MGVLNSMAQESATLLTNQGQQLRAAAEKIGRPARNVKDAKTEMIEAREYTSDSNRLTIYCCVLISLIVLVILMIVYASAK